LKRKKASRPETYKRSTSTGFDDLTDAEVVERAQRFAQVLEALEDKLERFVEAGCPATEDETLSDEVGKCQLDFARAFVGAEEWRAAREGVIEESILHGGLLSGPENVPVRVLAAFWCDIAFDAKKSLAATIRRHLAALVASRGEHSPWSNGRGDSGDGRRPLPGL